MELAQEKGARHEEEIQTRVPLELDGEPLKLSFDIELFKDYVSSPVNNERVDRAKLYMIENYEFREAIAEGALEVINKANEQNIETIFFLDRSARPFGFFVLRLYQELYPGESHPDIKFVNIGREDNGKYDDPIAIEHAKHLFETAIDNKKVLIVDDVVKEGTTKERAFRFFQDNFTPDSLDFTTIYPTMDYFASRNQLMHVNKTITGVKDGEGLIAKVSNFDEPDENLFDTTDLELLPEGTTSADLKRTEFLAMRDELSRLAIEVSKHIKNKL